VTTLPGWDSLDTVATYARWFTYAGWAALFSLGVFEILAHTYSVRERNLAEAQQSEIAAKHRDAAVKAATDGLREENKSLRSEVEKVRTRTEFRSLTSDQQRRIRDKMKQFRDLEGALFIYNSIEDASGIAHDIISSLEGPEYPDWKFRSQAGIGSTPPEAGILIEICPNAKTFARQAADELANALRQEGLYVPEVRPWAKRDVYIPGGIPATCDIIISVERRQ
jgi:hypothetical protein